MDFIPMGLVLIGIVALLMTAEIKKLSLFSITIIRCKVERLVWLMVNVCLYLFHVRTLLILFEGSIVTR